ncbi:solute carrier family 13 member 1-like [Lethenteron reissneri]|uniref:solute carrier family 13 member 1-like n=1 Tax=Lethenteron reissneri TaxID=7753 RepID=UPI002AB77BA3|nr:solute carrier family 13 member 1-like [Lethenteron reissneri]XP_061420237.1 solute carrier family 13 member 1-like [Lethenteron reissneri]
MWRQLWSGRRLLIATLAPLLLLPLPLLWRSKEAACAYTVLLTATLWVSEAVPLGAAALLPAMLYPLLGIMRSSQVAAEYFKDTTLLLLGVICLTAAIEKWCLHRRIALRMVTAAGARPSLLVLGFMVCTAFLSMWLSNTSTSALVMPIAEAVLTQLAEDGATCGGGGKTASAVTSEGAAMRGNDSTTALLPKGVRQTSDPQLSFGVASFDVDNSDDEMTVDFKEEPTVVTVSQSIQDGDKISAFHQQEVIAASATEVITALDGPCRDVATFGLSATPQDRVAGRGVPNGCAAASANDAASDGEAEGRRGGLDSPASERTVLAGKRGSAGKGETNRTLGKCLTLAVAYASTIGGLCTIPGTSTNLIFAEQFSNRYPACECIHFGSWLLFSFPVALLLLIFTWLWLTWLFLGFRIWDLRRLCSGTLSTQERMSERRMRQEYEKLGPISYQEVVTASVFLLMVLLWFLRDPGFVPGWASFFLKGYQTDATVSLLLGFLLFVVPSERPPLPWLSKTQRVKRAEESSDSWGSSPALINWKDFQGCMPWEIVILVGGGFALAAGCQVSGLSLWVGSQLQPLGLLPPWLVVLLSSLLVTSVTEVASNPATITLFLPILCTLSENMHVNPLYVAVPATLSTSLAMMLPVANPPNAIAFSYGYLRVRDMVKAGLGVNIIGMAVVMLAIHTWGFSMFGLDKYPEWAATNATAGL